MAEANDKLRLITTDSYKFQMLQLLSTAVALCRAQRKNEAQQQYVPCVLGLYICTCVYIYMHKYIHLCMYIAMITVFFAAPTP